MNPFNEFIDEDEMEELAISEHFFLELAERWYQIIHPEMTQADPADLINQMTLVSLGDAVQLKEWYNEEL